MPYFYQEHGCFLNDVMNDDMKYFK